MKVAQIRQRQVDYSQSPGCIRCGGTKAHRDRRFPLCRECFDLERLTLHVAAAAALARSLSPRPTLRSSTARKKLRRQ